MKTGEPISYHQMQQEREQALEADGIADGHDALRLQAEKGRLPEYPALAANSPGPVTPLLRLSDLARHKAPAPQKVGQ